MSPEPVLEERPIPTRERPLELYGRVAIVTGAANGIGRLVCTALAEEGARLVMAGRDSEALAAHAATLVGLHPDGGPVTAMCDVTVEQQTEALARRAMEAFGRIDILVNTAGVIGPIETPAHEVDRDAFASVLEVNVLGTFLPCKAVIPSMIAQRSGRIVNIAGTSGLRGYRNRVGYSSSKWAVRGLTRTLALELGEHGITVNDICPNVTNGRRMDTIVEAKAQRLGKPVAEVYGDFAGQTALGRFVDEADIAEAVRFLASDRARNITGHDVVVDAGWDV